MAIDTREAAQDMALVAIAEHRIQRILIDLAGDVGRDIENVHIDTRNFANYAVEIFFGAKK